MVEQTEKELMMPKEAFVKVSLLVDGKMKKVDIPAFVKLRIHDDPRAEHNEAIPLANCMQNTFVNPGEWAVIPSHYLGSLRDATQGRVVQTNPHAGVEMKDLPQQVPLAGNRSTTAPAYPSVDVREPTVQEVIDALAVFGPQKYALPIDYHMDRD